MLCASDLSTRSDTLTLAPFAVALAYKPLLSAGADAAAWRIVEAFSVTGAPFALTASWSAGWGAGTNARITVARAARVCVYARSLDLRAANLSSAENRIGVTVADAYAVTENQWEEPGSGGQGVETEVPIPPFALRVRVDVADSTALPGTIVRLYDGFGTLRTRLAASNLGAGLPIGNGGRLTVALAGNVDWRAVFTLGL